MANNNPSKIPNSLRNASVEFPYIGEGVDIYDSNNNTSVQETLNLHQSEIDGLNSQNYLSYIAEEGNTLADILPQEGAVDTIYRVGNWDATLNDGAGGYDVTKYTEYAWNGTQYLPMDVKDMTLATAEDFEEPDAEKRAKVVSVGAAADVYGAYVENPEFLSVKVDSEQRIIEATKKDGTKLFGAGVEIGGNANVKGGMSVGEDVEIKGGISIGSDINTQFEEITVIDSPEFIVVWLDNEGRIILGIRKNADVLFGYGIPSQIKQYVDEKVAEFSPEVYEQIVAFLEGYLGSETTLRMLLDTKVDKKEGKDLVNSEFAEGVSYIDNPEYIDVKEDAQGKVLEGIQQDGTKHIPGDLRVDGSIINEEMLLQIESAVDKKIGSLDLDKEALSSITYSENPEYIQVVTDSEGRITEGVTTEGRKKINLPIDTPASDVDYTDNPEWVDVKIDKDGKILIGIKRDGSFVFDKTPQLEYFNHYSGLSLVNDGEFSADMTNESFVSLYNSKLVDFCELCKCQVYCMNKLSIKDSDEEQCKKINHNFRKDVVYPGMDRRLFMSILNRYFTIPIYRFCDAKLNTTNDINASLRVGNDGEQFQTSIGEPSSLISDDGNKIELFISQGYYTESSDGVNWAALTPYSMHGNTWDLIEGHMSVNKVDGKYMMVAHTHYGNREFFDLLESEDKINFYFKGHLFENGVTDIGSGHVTNHIGNTYLFKDKGGKYYLIYEAGVPDLGTGWKLNLMSCEDIYSEQPDGYIGDWVQCNTNPIMTSKDYPCCNPEIIKGQDNQPLKYNGCYYMYYLSYTFEWGPERVASIRRAYSEDLVHWTDEGIVFDNRDTPDGGEHNADNGDQSMCEFKGRSYFFYTHNVNNYGEGTYPVLMGIRYTIDDRPFRELLKIKA